MSLPLSSSPSLSTFNAPSLPSDRLTKAPYIFSFVIPRRKDASRCNQYNGNLDLNQQPSILLTVAEVS